MDMYAWSKEETVRYIGITYFTAGIAALGISTAISPLAKRFDERKLLIFFGIIPMLFGRFLLTPISTEMPTIYNNDTNINGKCRKTI